MPLYYNKKSPLLLISALLTLYCGHSVAASEIPDAGILQQQTVPTLPAQPSSGDTGISPIKEAGITDSTPFTVNHITFKGNTKFSSEILHEIVKDIEGTEQTLTKLQTRVYIISDYYHDNGYPFARAIIPQQEVTNGNVVIELIEAKYGEIKLNNQSQVDDDVINGLLSPLGQGLHIEQKQLDRSLLLLSELPGTNINANVEAGQAVATTDLQISAEEVDNFIGRVTADSYGNQFINRGRLGASLNFLNPAKHGDVLSVNLLTTGKRMQYGQVSYDLLVNGKGTHIGASVSAMRYKLGGGVEQLGINGRSKTAAVWVKHPFVRGKQYNLYGQLQFNYNDLEDRVDANLSQNDRTVNDFTLTLNGDMRDRLMAGGVTSWRASVTRGDKDFDNAIAAANDALTANTEGSFSKFNFNINRLQQMTAKTSVWLSLTGQLANDNLDSSQKMVFGGPFSVRAYDTGAVSGDEGYLATAEVRHLLSQQHGYWQAVLFADVGHVKVNETVWAGATGANQDTLAGFGLGLHWSGYKSLSAKAQIARSVSDSGSLTQGSDKSIAWVEFNIGF